MSDVLEALQALGIPVLGENENRKTGVLEYKSYCPYHRGGGVVDRTPGWYINSETGEHLCFSCGFRGTLQVLAYRLLQVTWEEAADWVNKRTDILARFLERDAWALEDRGPRKQMAPINDARILGFSAVPAQMLADRNISRAAADSYEIRWDAQREAWILPIRSPDGLLLGWQVKGTGPDRYFRNYPMGVAKGSALFGLQTLSGTGDVGVVESPLDAARLNSLGFEAVATYGAMVTEVQMDLLIENAYSLVVCMDNYGSDAAGARSALWMMGLGPDGKALRSGKDYSRLIRIKFFNYEGVTAKDPGPMRGSEIRHAWRTARGSVRGPQAVLA